MRNVFIFVLLMLSCIIYAESWTGTGWALKDGYIVTNNHVINGAEKITVTMTNSEKYEAVLIGADEKTDIAVFQTFDFFIIVFRHAVRRQSLLTLLLFLRAE